MNISDEAVEAAARALYKGQPLYDEAAGVITGHKPWEWTEPSYQEAMLAESRQALEAAAPHIASMWHDAVSAAYVEGALSADAADVMYNKNPYRSAGVGE